MKSLNEKYRILLSRIAAFIAFFLIVFSKSVWENTIVEYFLFSFGIVLVAIASLGRMWCSLYIAGFKNKKLITDGPYSISRNPLYFFSFLGTIGLGLTTETLSFPFLFGSLFLLYYPGVIKSEERRLEKLFGNDFLEYKQTIPRIIPNFSLYQEPERYIVNPKVYRKHIFSALWFIWFVGMLEIIEGFEELGIIHPLWSLY
jgi:protein-S-isoprenylcysteine O-methyltransferase Ste14